MFVFSLYFTVPLLSIFPPLGRVVFCSACRVVVCGMIGVPMKGMVIMMATATTTKTTRKNHFYVACWNYGIGVTDSAGNPYVWILVFDTAAAADAYANDHAYEDGHSYAERVDACYAVRIMRRQLFVEMVDILGIPLAWRDEVS